ncbi:FKBP-type peptidyl-prolyl cis-trans isomerase [Candidatus Saccharibacteria bacterium]|nr:FKBP-type peptidyl-prolyl cis-trans isomerase [Candidatus Saccharibacteria bacterium]
MVQPVTELQVIDLVPGTGAEVKADSAFKAHYTGAFAVNGEIFGSTKNDEPLDFTFDSVLPGWQQGVPGTKVGGIRRLIIPASLAYGEAPEGYIPNAQSRPLGALVFDVEVISIN